MERNFKKSQNFLKTFHFELLHMESKKCGFSTASALFSNFVLKVLLIHATQDLRLLVLLFLSAFLTTHNLNSLASKQKYIGCKIVIIKEKRMLKKKLFEMKNIATRIIAHNV